MYIIYVIIINFAAVTLTWTIFSYHLSRLRGSKDLGKLVLSETIHAFHPFHGRSESEILETDAGAWEDSKTVQELWRTAIC